MTVIPCALMVQIIHNSVARVSVRMRKVDDITPLLMDLHWLPVEST